VKIIKRKKKIKVKEVFISDIHIPYHNQLALEIALHLIEEFNPNIIYLGGDIIDFYAVSSWLTDPTERNILFEIQELTKFLERLRKKFKKQRIIYHEGNHEERLMKYIFKKAEALAPLFKYDLSMPNILNLKKFNIEYVNQINRIGKLYHLHGHERKFAGQVVHIALNILRFLQRSFVCGHFHRFNQFVQKELDKSLKGGWVSGTFLDLKRLPTPYEKVDTNQFGFLKISYDEDGYFFVEPVIFIPVNHSKFLVKIDSEIYEFK